jgi:hypothetical protein
MEVEVAFSGYDLDSFDQSIQLVSRNVIIAQVSGFTVDNCTIQNMSLLDSGVSVAYHIVSKDSSLIQAAWSFFVLSLIPGATQMSALRSAFAGAIEGMGQSLPGGFVLQTMHVVSVICEVNPYTDDSFLTITCAM